ncbi:trypsin-7-like [Condylostylus longicornis]|uniref:trypsin-7-like n=1 Tax=Condylostylus longicornis TaxID=2530218 RepID=UPI00244E291E|nr:trypsin-7-like [Condylostylus longicornis]
MRLISLLAFISCALVVKGAYAVYFYEKNNTGNHRDFINEEDYFPKLIADRKPKYKPIRMNRCATCHCGWINSNRIVGGFAVRYNKYPWIAQLTYNSRFFCGGSLINDKFVLTAAHCTTGFKANNLGVRLLQFDRNAASTGIHRAVKQIIAHPNYNTRTLDNDIALLELSHTVPLNGATRPVCLPDAQHTFDYQDAIVAGWGLTVEQGQVSSILREVTVPVISNNDCKKTKYGNMITENMLCAGDVKKGGKDACQGDSGGPLIAPSKSNGRTNAFALAGVVSYGYGCAKANAPGVYARVTKYLPWILQNTQNSCYCSN